MKVSPRWHNWWLTLSSGNEFGSEHIPVGFNTRTLNTNPLIQILEMQTLSIYPNLIFRSFPGSKLSTNIYSHRNLVQMSKSHFYPWCQLFLFSLSPELNRFAFSVTNMLAHMFVCVPWTLESVQPYSSMCIIKINGMGWSIKIVTRVVLLREIQQ